ncbi:MAG: hypothetical protein JO089_03285 [Alphaproteobacteria bacterium]|nr:hypothetical protein [Alphaproteobacteria bacterium]
MQEQEVRLYRQIFNRIQRTLEKFKESGVEWVLDPTIEPQESAREATSLSEIVHEYIPKFFSDDEEERYAREDVTYFQSAWQGEDHYRATRDYFKEEPSCFYLDDGIGLLGTDMQKEAADAIINDTKNKIDELSLHVDKVGRALNHQKQITEKVISYIRAVIKEEQGQSVSSHSLMNAQTSLDTRDKFEQALLNHLAAHGLADPVIYHHIAAAFDPSRTTDAKLEFDSGRAQKYFEALAENLEVNAAGCESIKSLCARTNKKIDAIVTQERAQMLGAP